MSLYTDVRGALQTWLRDMPGALTNIAWETRQYSPVQGQAYMAPVFLPGTIEKVTMGDDGLFHHSGSFEVSLVYPSVGETATIEAMADLVRSRFRTGTEIPAGSGYVRIRSAQRSEIMPDADWIRVNVSVEWFFHSTDQ